MSERNQFNSILAPFIHGLLEEKKALGFLYDTEEMILARFDRYCIENKVEEQGVTREFLNNWCLQSQTEGLSNQRKRITVVRQLMLYMISMGEMVYLPKFTGRKETVLPHIFTLDELLSFFEEVDGYIPLTNRREDRRMGNEYRVLFRLLYCCGLRNSEGCGIAKDQVDLENGILTILDSKGNKDRLVYVSEDLLLLCKEYYNYLCTDLNSEPRWFFPGKNPEFPLRNTSVDRVFNRFWAKTKFSSSCNNKPTVHDLRFTFVTDRINLWVLQGKNTELMMPYLQKYLGHKSIQESYYYYHTSRQLFDAIRSRDKTADVVIPEVAGDE